MPSSWIPEEPEVPAEHRSTGRVPLRYEDVSQDGFLMLEALPHAVDCVWRALGESHDVSVAIARGVVPILSSIVVEGGEGPLSATAGPLEGSGSYRLAHTVDASGATNRILLDMWAQVTGPLGRTYGDVEGAGRRIVAGRVFAQHVFTRPFAPPGERKVLSLAEVTAAAVPPERVAWRAPEALLELPEGARALDPELSLDPSETVFGRDHTDSNQHVNSLVYTRLFIEAALRRLAAHGRAKEPLLARAIEIAYRRPSFAGEQVRVALRSYEHGRELGIAAVLIGATEPLATARPRCLARLLLAR